MDNFIKYNYDEINKSVSAINTIKDDINSKWKDIRDVEIGKMQNLWTGNSAKAYADKVLSYDKKINAVIQSLDLLSSTLSKAANKLAETENEAKNYIDNM